MEIRIDCYEASQSQLDALSQQEAILAKLRKMSGENEDKFFDKIPDPINLLKNIRENRLWRRVFEIEEMFYNIPLHSWIKGYAQQYKVEGDNK